MRLNEQDLTSFVPVDPSSDFPIQNLPYGVFSTPDNTVPRVGVAIGDSILDLWELEQNGLFDLSRDRVFCEPSLNRFMALGPEAWTSTRARIRQLLSSNHPELRDDEKLRTRSLVAQRVAKMHLPLSVSAFTDFYSSREHATNVGTMFRGKDNALQPNWLHMPIGYNGRASTVVASGAKITRPWGQLKDPGASLPSFGPSRRLDFELEIGVVIGQPSAMGVRLVEAEAESMIFGFVLLNDWSARDIQAWEYVPLGPFQSKAFATSISPWIVTREALEPFRVHGPVQEPMPLKHLAQRGANNYDIELDVCLQHAGSDISTNITRTNFKFMYWSSVQQLLHHTSSGCAMNVGDLLGSGTISGPEKHQRGSLIEIASNGTEPLRLSDGSERSFIADGDSLTIRGWCQGKGYKLGFGAVEGTVVA